MSIFRKKELTYRSILPFIEDIKTKLIPKVREYGININDNEIERTATSVSFIATTDRDNQAKISFYSNSLDAIESGKDKALFCEVFYRLKGTNTKELVDLDEIDKSARMIYLALWKIGFRKKSNKDGII